MGEGHLTASLPPTRKFQKDARLLMAMRGFSKCKITIKYVGTYLSNSVVFEEREGFGESKQHPSKTMC